MLDLLGIRRFMMSVAGGSVSGEFVIGAPNTLVSETCQCVATVGGREVTGAVWVVAAGQQYATIDNTGLLTVLPGANEATVVLGATWDGMSAYHTMTVTYKSGASSETETESVIDEYGNTTTTTTTTTDNGDGSSTVETEVIITDENGNTIGTEEGMVTNNADGSYESTYTEYDENGDPGRTTNASGDTSGNISTQTVGYDESGNSAVTSYVVDTSENPSGEKTYNGDGVNTEYYAFDLTHGFIMNVNFTINFAAQPSGQDENHHNIVTMKRATPTPWYGFQLRQTGTNKYIILGTQFATGSNTNTNLSGQTISGSAYEYDLTIQYNPTASTQSFVARDNLAQRNVYTSNLKFPDLEELRYLKVTIGCALDANGQPYRYSNINLKNFSIIRT